MTKEYIINIFTLAKFRKVKSMMLVEALKLGTSTRGNHRVDYDHSGDTHVFTFNYRDTEILEVKILDSTIILTEDIYAGEFDNTPATIRQRQDIRTAMNEIQTFMINLKKVV